MNPLRSIWGLDHKCIKCGHALSAHDPEFRCMGRDSKYTSKGPQVSYDFRGLLEEFESAGVALAFMEAGDVAPGYEEAKERYKHARFLLFSYVSGLEKQ